MRNSYLYRLKSCIKTSGVVCYGKKSFPLLIGPRSRSTASRPSTRFQSTSPSRSGTQTRISSRRRSRGIRTWKENSTEAITSFEVLWVTRREIRTRPLRGRRCKRPDGLRLALLMPLKIICTWRTHLWSCLLSCSSQVGRPRFWDCKVKGHWFHSGCY